MSVTPPHKRITFGEIGSGERINCARLSFYSVAREFIPPNERIRKVAGRF